MARIHNTRQASITLAIIGVGSVVLLPGANEVADDVLDKCAADPDAKKYVEALYEAGEIVVDASSFESHEVDDEDLNEAMYAHDSEGARIQAVDEAGEPLFDETTGEPVWQLAEAQE